MKLLFPLFLLWGACDGRAVEIASSDGGPPAADRLVVALADHCTGAWPRASLNGDPLAITKVDFGVASSTAPPEADWAYYESLHVWFEIDHPDMREIHAVLGGKNWDGSWKTGVSGVDVDLFVSACLDATPCSQPKERLSTYNAVFLGRVEHDIYTADLCLGVLRFNEPGASYRPYDVINLYAPDLVSPW